MITAPPLLPVNFSIAPQAAARLRQLAQEMGERHGEANGLVPMIAWGHSRDVGPDGALVIGFYRPDQLQPDDITDLDGVRIAYVIAPDDHVRLENKIIDHDGRSFYVRD